MNKTNDIFIKQAKEIISRDGSCPTFTDCKNCLLYDFDCKDSNECIVEASNYLRKIDYFKGDSK